MNDRKYIAISIKHSSPGKLVLWGFERTKDEEQRCFAGYQGIYDYDYCELYSLEDFWTAYGNGVIKCDEPVPMTSNLVNEWADYDTVLVDYEEYKKFVAKGLRRAEHGTINKD